MGDPDPRRDLQPPVLGDKYVAMRTGVVWVVLSASVGLPIFVLVCMLLGLSAAAGAAALGTVMAPLVIFARSIANHLFS